MNRLIHMFSIIMILTPPAAADVIERPPMEILYIVNEGFLVECAGQKIVIDGLFGGFQSQWYYTPLDSALEQMKTAQPPFDSIDVIAVTHPHRDHFDAGIVAAHMQHNPRAVPVCPPQAAEVLAATEHYANIESRIRVVPAPGDSAVTMTITRIELVIFPTRHGPYMETDTDLHCKAKILPLWRCVNEQFRDVSLRRLVRRKARHSLSPGADPRAVLCGSANRYASHFCAGIKAIAG